MAVLSNKSDGMWAFIDNTSMQLYGRKPTECIPKDICVVCGEEAKVFDGPMSEQEYSMSGMCQACQDSLFNSFEGGC